jgi:hypothetical protein
MLGTREGEEEAFFLQQTEGPKIEILISSRSIGQMAFLFSKRRGVENDHIILRFKVPQELKSIPLDHVMGDSL